MERMARGSMSETPTAVSEVFSQSMMKLMTSEECLTDKGDYIDIKKLREKLETRVIDVEVFNQLLKQDCIYFVESTNIKID